MIHHAMIACLAISGYRSLRDLRLSLDNLNVVTGANGSGKSSLYRALRLLADIAQGRVVQSLAMEGGIQSTLWAGPESFSRAVKRGELPVQGTSRRNPISLKLGFSSGDYGYAIDLGLPVSSHSLFDRDPTSRRRRFGTAISSAARMRLRCATGLACVCAETPAHGSRSLMTSRPSTAW